MCLYGGGSTVEDRMCHIRKIKAEPIQIEIERGILKLKIIKHFKITSNVSIQRNERVGALPKETLVNREINITTYCDQIESLLGQRYIKQSA